VDPAFEHEFFDMARAQGVGDIPADAHKNDILGKMRPLKLIAIVALLSRHSTSQGESIPQIASNENCDRTLFLGAVSSAILPSKKAC
jgi:hypothetical protein